jgi:1-aminocyclopropane-1-carboxylate deaminase/D-cysteine desulfhydrase-like pyridoxal-dependent ACC family enzyme
MDAAALRAVGARLFPELSTLGPSPLERWTLPKGWPLSEIWVKRDDRLGDAGTKLRKLAVALARAKVAGGGLLTIGYLDSNHALATARLAKPLGIPVRLELLGDPASDAVRAQSFREAAPSHFHSTTAGLLVGAALGLMGKHFRLLPPGGTTALTTAAVALAVGEACEQLTSAAVPNRWAVAVGTGGTLAGLWAGVRALGLPVRPYGVAVSSRLVGPRRVARLANEALEILGSSARVRPGEIEIDRGQLGGGHASPTAASISALAELAVLGYPLEPIFTAKAMAGLRARATGGESWLFWHTGMKVA